MSPWISCGTARGHEWDTITVNTRCEKDKVFKKWSVTITINRLSPKRRRHLVKSFMSFINDSGNPGYLFCPSACCTCRKSSFWSERLGQYVLAAWTVLCFVVGEKLSALFIAVFLCCMCLSVLSQLSWFANTGPYPALKGVCLSGVIRNQYTNWLLRSMRF